jgi:demethylmenaquinone methyltransferase / 2-methoxy-6-polyprenyl-1,4-benzoquinol methylase
MSSLEGRKKESYKIFDQIAPTYDLLNHLLSFGIDVYWRKQMLKELPLRDKMHCLDLACGTGDVSLTLAGSPKIQSIEGLDMSEGMVEFGRKKVQKKNLEDKVQLNIGDGVTIPRPDQTADVVTLTFGIRNFSDPQESIRNIYRVLKPGGRALILEFGMPRFFLVRWVYTFYFRYLLPFIGNLISGHSDAYTYLNKTVEDFPFGEDFAKWMREAGLENVRYRSLSFGIAYLYVGEKPHE